MAEILHLGAPMTSKKSNKGSLKGWKYHFDRRDRAAREGRHLPSVGDLLTGMSFYLGNIQEDAQAWAERLLLRLDEEKNGFAAADVFLALKKLTVGPRAEDYKFAHGAFSGPGANHLPENDGARRCLVYRVAAGDLTAIGQLCGLASRRLRNDIRDVDEGRACNDLILGLSTYASVPKNKYENIDFFQCRMDGTFLRDGYEAKPTSAAPAARTEQATKPKPPVENDGPGLVVFSSIGNDKLVADRDKIGKMFRPLIGKRLTLLPVPRNLRQISSMLRTEFPHALGVIDSVLTDVVARKTVGLKPTVLAGPPGCGKTTFAMRLANLLGVPSQIYGCAGVHDAKFTGVSRTWSTGEPSIPASFIASTEIANPVMILDEIEKAGGSDQNGKFLESLLPLLESRTAVRYFDPYIESEIDLSAVIYLATANDPSRLPAPLRDRCRILSFPSPDRKYLPALVPSVLRGIVEAQGLDARWISPLTGEELEALSEAWPGQSLRSLQRLLETVLRCRDQCVTAN
jgi:ATPase family associated with various cellular activities (AAA)